MSPTQPAAANQQDQAPPGFPSKGAAVGAVHPAPQRINSRRGRVGRISSSGSVGRTNGGLDILLQNNREWSLAVLEEDEGYFDRLAEIQTPQYLWIGCSDSRVPANTIVGLEPGEVFVHRNVGNQASHMDLNCMSCLEFSVSVLKVKTIIVTGHYNCGAVKAALQLPNKTAGLVNVWISDIRKCRDAHAEELRDLADAPQAQVDRLCELNVLRQAFHVCTSPVVQAAWSEGQHVEVYACIYSLKDGRLKCLAGPLSGNAQLEGGEEAFMRNLSAAAAKAALPKVTSIDNITPLSNIEGHDADAHAINTLKIASEVAQHVSWNKDKASGGSSTQSTPAKAPNGHAVASPQSTSSSATVA